jgi:hypothetical protein
VLDAVIAASGALEPLKEMAASLDSLGPPPARAAQGAGPRASLSAARSDFGGIEIGTPEQLSFYMRAQADIARNQARAEATLGRLGIAVGGLGLLTGPLGAGVAALTGATWFVVSFVADGFMQTLPSKLDPLTVELSVRNLPEDATLGGFWRAQVTARGGEWIVAPGRLVDGVLVGAGGRIGEFYSMVAKKMGFSEAGRALFAEFYNQTFAQLNAAFGGAIPGEGLYVRGPYTYGPIDVSHTRYSTPFTSANGVISFEPNNPNRYGAVAPGQTQLVVRTRPEWFAGKIAEGRESVTVDRIELEVSPPSGTEVRIGSTQIFQVGVSGSETLGATWSVSGGTVVDAAGAFLEWRAPSTEGTYTITARHKIKTDRSASVQVSVVNRAAVEITPVRADLRPGKTQAFRAVVEGNTDQRVTWSATGGTVDAQGLYTAPQQLGTYYVTATSVADPRATFRATVQVVSGPSVRVIAPATSVWARYEGEFTAAVTGSAEGVYWDYNGIAQFLEEERDRVRVRYLPKTQGDTAVDYTLLIIARSREDPSVADTASVQVRAPFISVSRSADDVLYSGQSYSFRMAVNGPADAKILMQFMGPRNYCFPDRESEKLYLVDAGTVISSTVPPASPTVPMDGTVCGVQVYLVRPDYVIEKRTNNVGWTGDVIDGKYILHTGGNGVRVVTRF